MAALNPVASARPVMRAAVLARPGSLSVRDDWPRPSSSSLSSSSSSAIASVVPLAVGICGSDVHYWQHGRIGPFVVRSPLILGHESCGVVTEIFNQDSTNSSALKSILDGAGQPLRVGDLVAIEPGVGCQACSYCHSGRYNLCNKMQFHATPPYHGTLAEVIMHPADRLFVLPRDMDPEEGAVCEPLAVAVHATKRARVKLNSTVLIMGAGPVGILCMLVCKAMGARSVAIADVRADRLTFAKSLGADLILDARMMKQQEHKEGDEGQEGQEGQEEREDPPQYDAAIECSGAPSAIRAAITNVKSGGTAVLVGMGPPGEIPLPVISAAIREVDIRGVFRYANCFAQAAALISSRSVDVRPLITHRFLGLDSVVEAFQTAADPDAGAVKIMIRLDAYAQHMERQKSQEERGEQGDSKRLRTQ